MGWVKGGGEVREVVGWIERGWSGQRGGWMDREGFGGQRGVATFWDRPRPAGGALRFLSGALRASGPDPRVGCAGAVRGRGGAIAGQLRARFWAKGNTWNYLKI